MTHILRDEHITTNILTNASHALISYKGKDLLKVLPGIKMLVCVKALIKRHLRGTDCLAKPLPTYLCGKVKHCNMHLPRWLQTS